MALFAAQLQPWEENQSPSPTETDNQNPYELALARSRSSSSKSGSAAGHGQYKSTSSDSNHHNSKPASPINTLHRQLSGDPEAPPPAWKRRTSTNTNPRSTSSGPPSASRRHPGLQMTLSTGLRQPLPDQMFLHESPNSSSTDLAELGLPQPAFRRRRSNASSGLSSNRSSTHSLTSGLTSEELWKMDQEANQPDLSNPSRQARERPLDTVRRMSRTYEPASQLPGEVIWPSAMEEPSPMNNAALRSKSSTSIAKITQSKLTIRKRSSRSRNQSFETPPGFNGNDGVYLHSPNSLSRPESMIITSSAHSSTTSLNSQGLSPLKTAGNRPPSAYYSRDFLSSLAPREGGYAIAATMGNGLGAHGAMSVDERRRSQVPDQRRAPMAKSAGMGRWSLDGGEHYARPYGTPSAATTASNLSGPPLNSPDVSPPVAEIHLPEGASAPVSANMSPQSSSLDQDQSQIMPLPSNPSPLSQHTHANDVVAPPGDIPPAPLPLPVASESPAAHAGVAVPGGATAPAPASSSTLKTKKSKKDLAKEAKAAKVEAQKAEHIRKAEEKAAAVKAKADRKQAEAKAKEEMKRKEKEEKERRKAEKKAKKSGSSSIPASASVATKPTPTSTSVPFPKTSDTVSGPPTSPPRQNAQSMPLNTIASPPPIPSTSTQSVRTKASESTLKTKQPKLGFLGTLKKRFSGPTTSLADVRMRKESDAANLSSMPPPPGAATSATTPQTPKTEIRTSSMAASAFNTPPPAMDFSPSSAPVPVAAPLELAPVVDAAGPTTGATGSNLSPRPDNQALMATSTSPSPSARSLSKVTSRDQHSQSHSPRSRSASLRGPRPMPQTGASPRPESIATQPITTAGTGFPFKPTNVEAVTPTTSAESSMFSTGSQSHETGNAEVDTGSPFTSIDSRKNSLDGSGLERKDSMTPKASDETAMGRTEAGIAA